MFSLRWAVSLAQSEACVSFESLFRRALQCLPNEDVEKQRRFRFREDSLACVLSRILIRQVVRTCCQLPWHTIEIERSERGKPYVSTPKAQLKFNVSHQGDLVVLASSEKEDIGVDVMRIDEDRSTSAQEHIERMAKLFSEGELQMMRSAATEREKWMAFYRIWCLKESVLKADGTGLVNNLSAYDFHTGIEKHCPGCFITSTTWHKHGVRQHNWLFEESFIGENHCVAVARILSLSHTPAEEGNNCTRRNLFSMMSFERLLDGSTIINPMEDGGIKEYEEFMLKPSKPF
ncbi:hypothetical protein KIN20_001199 [Parelaphostrongylus tenuis]|uniref:L-aminoadipate-semialdehyde dehydrogenase-phosphopantetheinyl transferase n=1 Tax=Parelaphostrongylus tenuis TaxID=148309 RepID=A0AAD5QG36_PARTN|nr:hypothetical protein KIN20_001199 [Parelaphostrongylus tenuis]